MDRFREFLREEYVGERLEIEPEKLRAIISRLLSELNLDLWYLEEEEGDIIAVSVDKLDRDVTSLVRIRSEPSAVDKEDIEELYEDMSDKRASNAIFITTSYFTKDAKELARDLPIRLVDGTELSEFIARYEEKYEEVKPGLTFLSSKSDNEVVKYFKVKRRKKILGFAGSEEKIEEIDRRYTPLGVFSIKKFSKDSMREDKAYIDLNSGELCYIEAGKIKRNDMIKRIMNLPPESREHLLDLMEHGVMDYEHVKGKYLSILEKKDLVYVYEREKGIIITLVDEVLGIFRSIFHGGELKPKEVTVKHVRSKLRIPEFDTSYDLEHFIESSSEIDKDYEPDPVNYKPEEILKILSRFYGSDVKFEGTVYLPYYRCKYLTPTGVRYKLLLSPKFRSFVPRPSEYEEIYKVIDKFPELPYLVLAAFYLIYDISEMENKIHVFSIAFLFVLLTVIVGTILKAIFRTERKIPYYGATIFRYGFPSLHSLASIGAIGFVYFVNPLFSLILIPIGLLYIYSRIKLGAHSVTDVLGGAIIGLPLGFFSGRYLLGIKLPYELELILCIIFFLMPIILCIFRVRYMP